MTDRTCSVDDCERPARARGWCSLHYKRWQYRGTIDDPQPQTPDGRCSIDGCEKPVQARGWCSMHYARWRTRSGDISDPVRLPKPACAVRGCDNPSKTRGWCVTHYSRWHRHGSVADPIRPPKPVCSVDTCARQSKTRGLCDKHYLRLLRHGTTAHPNPNRTHDGLCKVVGCSRRATIRGMCQTHTYRLKKFGSLDVPGSKPPFGTKWCRRCAEYRPLNQFYVSRKGPESPCKACRAIRDKKYRAANPPPSRISQNRKRRARLRALRFERYTAVEIAERDGWRCGICGQRIGKTYKYPHPRSLTIDHIIPIRHGGDDVKLNVQAAHFRCNASKGHRGVDQLRLIG